MLFWNGNVGRHEDSLEEYLPQAAFFSWAPKAPTASITIRVVSCGDACLSRYFGTGGAIHGRPWLPSPLLMLVNRIGLQLYMRPVDASLLAGLDGICGLTPDYPGGLWVPALPQAVSTPV